MDINKIKASDLNKTINIGSNQIVLPSFCDLIKHEKTKQLEQNSDDCQNKIITYKVNSNE